jgi:hypothetical protein
MKKRKHKIQLLRRPGRYLSDRKLSELSDELRAIAATCFEEIPEYQALTGDRKDLEDVVICVARERSGRAVAFSSAVILDVEGIGEVFHLGLTCVDPDARGSSLTHRMSSKLVVSYMLRYKTFGKLWCTNCACVLSSLGNVALNFAEVYPAPFGSEKPSKAHRAIAAAVDQKYREAIYINDSAEFDAENFVFRGSVKGTMFQKSAHDKRYHHRYDGINRYYSHLMRFDDGDEVLQVGYASIWWAIRYALRRRKAPQKLLVEASSAHQSA